MLQMFRLFKKRAAITAAVVPSASGADSKVDCESASVDIKTASLPAQDERRPVIAWTPDQLGAIATYQRAALLESRLVHMLARVAKLEEDLATLTTVVSEAVKRQETKAPSAFVSHRQGPLRRNRPVRNRQVKRQVPGAQVLAASADSIFARAAAVRRDKPRRAEGRGAFVKRTSALQPVILRYSPVSSFLGADEAIARETVAGLQARLLEQLPALIAAREDGRALAATAAAPTEAATDKPDADLTGVAGQLAALADRMRESISSTPVADAVLGRTA